MQFYDQIRRIEHIDFLIRSRSTGRPVELAQKLGISQSQLYQTMRIMKVMMDAPIYFSRQEQCYCYRERARFICTFRNQERDS
jgi:hypothetical protein